MSHRSEEELLIPLWLSMSDPSTITVNDRSPKSPLCMPKMHNRFVVVVVVVVAVVVMFFCFLFVVFVVCGVFLRKRRPNLYIALSCIKSHFSRAKINSSRRNLAGITLIRRRCNTPWRQRVLLCCLCGNCADFSNFSEFSGTWIQRDCDV